MRLGFVAQEETGRSLVRHLELLQRDYGFLRAGMESMAAVAHAVDAYTADAHEKEQSAAAERQVSRDVCGVCSTCYRHLISTDHTPAAARTAAAALAFLHWSARCLLVGILFNMLSAHSHFSETPRPRRSVARRCWPPAPRWRTRAGQTRTELRGCSRAQSACRSVR